MDFKPKTEEEIQKESLWPDGEYDFEVTEAKNATSKAGNAMIELTLRAFNPDGGERLINDYLLEAMAFKLRHFCAFTGLIEKYESGTLDASDCFGKTGIVKLRQKIQEGYAPKNEVRDYVNPNVSASATNPDPAAAKPGETRGGKALEMDNGKNTEDDNIPF